MRHYNVTVTVVTRGQYPNDALYQVAAVDADQAMLFGRDLARAQYPTADAFVVKQLIPFDVLDPKGNALEKVA